MRNYSLDLDQPWDVNSFLNELLNFVYFWYFCYSINNFLNYLLYFFNLLDHSLDWNYFFLDSLNLNNSVLEVGNDLFDLLDSFLGDYLLNKLLNLKQLWLFHSKLDDLFDMPVNLLYFSMDILYNDYLFNDLIDRHLYLDRNDNIPINLDYFWLLYNVCYYLLYL